MVVLVVDDDVVDDDDQEVASIPSKRKYYNHLNNSIEIMSLAEAKAFPTSSCNSRLILAVLLAVVS